MNLRMTEAQKTLYYIAENMKMDKSISDEGYEHFQQAIKALGQQRLFEDIKSEIKQDSLNDDEGDEFIYVDNVMRIIDKHIGKES